jgi:hypothetical protein
VKVHLPEPIQRKLLFAGTWVNSRLSTEVTTLLCLLARSLLAQRNSPFLSLFCILSSTYKRRPWESNPRRHHDGGEDIAKVAFLIRARSVVQVHPGPPYIPVFMRRFSLLPFSAVSHKVFLSTICQLHDRLNAWSSGSTCNHCLCVHPPAARDSDRSTGHLYEWRVFRPGGLLTIRLALISYGWAVLRPLAVRKQSLAKLGLGTNRKYTITAGTDAVRP